MKTVRLMFWGLLFATLAGCGTAPQANYKDLGLVKVSGNVTLDGTALPNATVKFESEDGQFSYGETDANGNYSLQFDSEKKGATPGEKIVRISTSASVGEEAGEEVVGEESEEGSASAKTKPAELVPAKYNTESELKRTVEPGRNQTFDFDLTSK